MSHWKGSSPLYPNKARQGHSIIQCMLTAFYKDTWHCASQINSTGTSCEPSFQRTEFIELCSDFMFSLLHQHKACAITSCSVIALKFNLYWICPSLLFAVSVHSLADPNVAVFSTKIIYPPSENVCAISVTVYMPTVHE